MKFASHHIVRGVIWRVVTDNLTQTFLTFTDPLPVPRGIPNMQGRKTTTRAFRIDDTVDRQLRELAEREGVTVSFLANKALRRPVECDIYADRFGFTALPKEPLSRIIALLPDADVRQP